MSLPNVIPSILAGLAGLLASVAAAAETRPNLVFILADDSGLGEFGCYGGTAIPTPNVDRLAREGLLFTNAYSGSAVCAPTRCVLMTGQHPGHGLRRANQSQIGLLALAAGTPTVARMLHDAGYATGGFGKWGLGNEGTTGAAEKQGFDLFYGYYDQVHAHRYFPDDLTRNGVREKLPGNRNGKGTQYSHDLIEAETLRFIETGARSGRPFFCYAAWTLPHGNFEIPSHAQFADRPWPEPVKIHAAMIARLDAGVGRVVEKLRELGIERNTLVIFTSDAGISTRRGTESAPYPVRHSFPVGRRVPSPPSNSGRLLSPSTRRGTSSVDGVSRGLPAGATPPTVSCFLAGPGRPILKCSTLA